MGTKERPKAREGNSDPYEDYDNDLGDSLNEDLDDLGYLSSDVNNMDWENPAGPDSRFSARRKIERRNELKELCSQFDEWDDVDLNNVW